MSHPNSIVIGVVCVTAAPELCVTAIDNALCEQTVAFMSVVYLGGGAGASSVFIVVLCFFYFELRKLDSIRKEYDHYWTH